MKFLGDFLFYEVEYCALWYKGRINMNWQMWAIGESAGKVSSLLFNKFAGQAISNPLTAVVFSLVIGVIQVVAGFLFRGKGQLWASRRDLFLSVLCGVGATISNVLGPVAFIYGATLAGLVFIIAMSVIPGMFIGRFLFGQKLFWRQILGIAFFLIGAWAILDGPDVYGLLTDMPVWLWIAVAIALTSANNEACRGGMSKGFSPMVYNFWVGVTTVFGSAAGYAFLFYGPLGSALVSDISVKLLLFSAATGIIVIAMISMSLRAYQVGAPIAIKKVLTNSLYLLASAVVGALFFGEAITILKLTGIVVFVLALILSDDAVFAAIFGKKDEPKIA